MIRGELRGVRVLGCGGVGEWGGGGGEFRGWSQGIEVRIDPSRTNQK